MTGADPAADATPEGSAAAPATEAAHDGAYQGGPASVLNHPRFRRVLVGVGLALVGILSLWWFRYRPFISTDDARIAAPMVVVVAQGAGGRVERVLVREGQTVAPGEPLVQLDAAVESAQLDRARALLALAAARVAEAQAQLQLEEHLAKASDRRAHANVSSAQAVHLRTVRGARAGEIAKARADVAAAESVDAQAQRDLERATSLSGVGAVTAASLETARTAVASARASLQSRRASLELIEQGSRPEDVSVSQAGVVQAEASLLEADAGADRVALRARQIEEASAQAAQARAELALAEIAVGRMTLKANAVGTVVRITVDPGDYLAPGQGAVAMVDFSQAWVAANVEETSAGLLRPGQPVSVSIDEGGELSGRVEVVTQSAASQFALIPSDNAAGNFTKVVQRIPIHIALDASPRLVALRLGQSVVVKIRVR
ncbi:MAG: efflux RND transporter periplasmic adaptor subunit [Archangium sp.]|nr:efflux RND transporter periplasmic adaptor subunit [Archangium sp.]